MHNRKKLCSIALSVILAVQVVLIQPVMASGVFDGKLDTYSVNEIQEDIRVEISPNIYAEFSEEGRVVNIVGNGMMLLNVRYFQGNTRIEKVVINEGITYISPFAFEACTNLKEVVIPRGLTTISGNLFRGCTSLSNIDIPDTVTTIEWNAFEGCTSLKSIELPNSIKTINSYAFLGCSNLENIKLSDNLTTIGIGAFKGCSNLKSINLPDSVTQLGGSAFESCTSLKEIIIPTGVTDLGMEMFKNCYRLSNIILPSTLKSVGIDTFKNCIKLEKINLPNELKMLGSGAFEGCRSLSSLTVPSTITNINDRTFYNCTSLTNIDIPNSIQQIGQYAFTNCMNLKGLQIPDGVKEIKTATFYGCEMLQSIDIPDSILLVEDYAFYGCNLLTSVTIPSSVLSIGKNAFGSCLGLETIKVMSNFNCSIFANCENIKKIVIGPSVNRIEGKLKNSDNIELYGYENTYANKYAGENNYIYRPIHVQIEETVISMLNYSTTKLELQIKPTDIINNQDIIWESQDSSIVEVDDYGNCIAKRTGSTLVKVTVYGKEYVYSINVIDVANDPILSSTELTLDLKEEYQLDLYTQYNEKIDHRLIQWSSKDSSIASVDENGIVTAIKTGTTQITATIGSISINSNVTVSDKQRYTLGIFSTPNDSGKLIGGGTYTEGETVVIKSNPLSGYQFVGWYDNDRLLSTESTYSFVIDTNMEITAKFIANTSEKLSVMLGGGIVEYRINDTYNMWYNDVNNIKVPKGTEITVNAIANSNATFLYWIDSVSGRILSRDSEYTFTMGKNVQIKACYRNQSDRHYVSFIDRNDEVLSSQEVQDGQAAMEPDHGYYNGYEFVGWDREFNNVTEHMTITAIYQPKSGYRLIVENGIIENQKEEYIFMEKVKVTANDPEPGMYFAGWYEGDILVSTNKEHYIFVTNTTILTAKYNETPIKEEPRVYMKLSERIPIEENKVSLTMQVNWQLPSGFSVIEGGLLRTLSVDEASELLLENVDNGTIIANKSTLVVSNGTYDYTLKFSEASKSKTLYARGYLIYKNDVTGETFTIYTTVMTSIGE